jgi:hypothetical protein
MNRLFASTLLLLASFGAQATIIGTVTDLNDSSTNVFTDAATPGLLAISSATSPILGTYWTGALEINVSSENILDDLATFISASTNLNALSTGKNVLISVVSDNFVNPTGLATFESIINASTVTSSSYDAQVLVDTTVLGTLLNISDTNTYTMSGAVAVPTPFSITHNFTLGASSVGGDLAFDISTRGIPVPAPLALIGLGLLGMVGVRKGGLSA